MSAVPEECELGSEKSSEHTDWAFVEDTNSQDTGNQTPLRFRSPGRYRRLIEGFEMPVRGVCPGGLKRYILSGSEEEAECLEGNSCTSALESDE